MFLLYLLGFTTLFLCCDSCAPYDIDWDPWGPCSHPCGGGRRHRSGSSCGWGTHKSEYGDCNKFCKNGVRYNHGCSCPAWRTDRCCGSCRHIYIAHCKPGQQNCGGSPDGIRCTDCEDPYYSAGYNRGCYECPSIDNNCAHRHCTSTGNVKCVSCYNDNSFFMRTHSDKKCERMCAWNTHYCWPGECPNKLTSSCKCAQGFRAVQTSAETSCQLEPTNTPTIETCETQIMGPKGELRRATSTTGLTTCNSSADFYGNFQPKFLIYDLLAAFTIDIGKVLKPPPFISESKFGVTDTTLNADIHDVRGSSYRLTSYSILLDTNNSTNATETFSYKQNKTLPSITLDNGDWLCISYEAKCGGYLQSFDLRQTSRVPSVPVPYTKTTATRRLCYRYDSVSPEHCQAMGTCTIEPLKLPERITRSDIFSVELTDWTDPIPSGGNSSHASGIESYEITLHEVIDSNKVLKVDIHNLLSIKVKSQKDPIVLNLTSSTPKLYALYVEVKDLADNTQHSRRFVLYDKTSQIEPAEDKPFFVETASQSTNFLWQIHHHDICLNWTNHFYNNFYLKHPLLNRIEPDPLVQSKYDQQSGMLPTSGTPNVDGIINFKFSWSLNNGNMSPEVDIPQFLLQHYCQSFSVNDGETYTLNIRAIDIAHNSYSENKTVHIDRSVPHINNIWLSKSGEPRLFVHDCTDLSEMNLNFEVIDPHSGIREVRWAFGTSDSSSVLLNGTIGVKRKVLGCCLVETSLTSKKLDV